MANPLVSLSRLAARGEPIEGSPITEAREAFEFWSRRACTLPWHRRMARREAHAMATRWRSRLVAAHLERWNMTWVEHAAAPLVRIGGRSAGRHARRLVWMSMRRTRVGRRVLAVAIGGVAILGVTVAASVAAVALYVLPI